MPFDSTPQHSHAAEIAIVGRMQELLATPDRWCQGDYTDRRGAFCVMGALKIADGKGAGDTQILSGPALNTMIATMAEVNTAVDRWNDTPGRTHAEVLDLLARVRRKLEEAE